MPLEAALFYVDAADIEGSNPIEARAKSSAVIEVHHPVYKPVNTQTGQATGKRVHEPIRILKRIDKATPTLLQALSQNTELPSLELRWYRPDPAGLGDIEHMYTVTIEQATVTRVEAWLPNTLLPEEAVYDPMEWVSFNYAKITWEWVVDGVVANDEWKAQVL